MSLDSVQRGGGGPGQAQAVFFLYELTNKRTTSFMTLKDSLSLSFYPDAMVYWFLWRADICINIYKTAYAPVSMFLVRAWGHQDWSWGPIAWPDRYQIVREVYRRITSRYGQLLEGLNTHHQNDSQVMAIYLWFVWHKSSLMLSYHRQSHCCQNDKKKIIQTSSLQNMSCIKIANTISIWKKLEWSLIYLMTLCVQLN